MGNKTSNALMCSALPVLLPHIHTPHTHTHTQWLQDLGVRRMDHYQQRNKLAAWELWNILPPVTSDPLSDTQCWCDNGRTPNNDHAIIIIMLVDLTSRSYLFCGRSIFTGKCVFGRSMRFFGVYNILVWGVFFWERWCCLIWLNEASITCTVWIDVLGSWRLVLRWNEVLKVTFMHITFKA